MASDLPLSLCHPDTLSLSFWVAEVAGPIGVARLFYPGTDWSGRSTRGRAGPFYVLRWIGDWIDPFGGGAGAGAGGSHLKKRENSTVTLNSL